MTTRVILIRHGRSHYNELGLFQGSCDDSLLTATGIEMAKSTGAYLGQFSIDALYTSPLQRAKQTANILGLLHPQVSQSKLAQPVICENLQEIHLPAWQGLKYKFVREKYADQYAIWKETPQKFTMFDQSGSPFYPVQELFARCLKFWQSIIPSHPNQTIAVVSHGGTIQALIATALGLQPQSFHRMQQSNCGISVLHFDTELNGPPQLESLNLTQHLGERLPKLKEGKRGTRMLFWVCDDDRPPIDIGSLALPGLKTYFQACSTSTVQSLLQKTLGNSLNPVSFNIQLGTYCIVHFPESVKYSIFQAINWVPQL